MGRKRSTPTDAIAILMRYHDAAWDAMHDAATIQRDRRRAEREVRAFALAIRVLERDIHAEGAL
ncbi:MAG TPA: hypothetical protein VG538_06050 [Vicinamibacterales bacterium]|jgi:hypothetical protein|nr:hypothetical protein [Vicinamibacterales bacterium]